MKGPHHDRLIAYVINRLPKCRMFVVKSKSPLRATRDHDLVYTVLKKDGAITRSYTQSPFVHIKQSDRLDPRTSHRKMHVLILMKFPILLQSFVPFMERSPFDHEHKMVRLNPNELHLFTGRARTK